MEPVRDEAATLSALVDSLLNKGVCLDLDAIITVAEIPLIGISLRAAVAGMETLLEYGMMDDWDERTRAWARRAVPPGLALDDGEDVITRMPGSYRRPSPDGGVWQPGTVFLTTERLVVHRREPEALLWEQPLRRITGIAQVSERSLGGEDVARLSVTTDDGATAHLSAARPDRLRDLALRARAGWEGESRPPRATAPGPLEPREDPSETRMLEADAVLEAEAWFLEMRSSGPAWRRGAARFDGVGGFAWRGHGDRRPAVRIGPGELVGVSAAGDGSEFGELPDTVAVLALASGGLAGRDQAGSGGEVMIAVGHAEEWRAALARAGAGAEQEQVGT